MHLQRPRRATSTLGFCGGAGLPSESRLLSNWPDGRPWENWKLEILLGTTIGLMVSLGRIGWRGPALAGLLDPRLKRQHGRLLIGLQVDVLLHAVDVLDTPFDDIAGVALSRRTLSGACVSEERPRVALPHHKYWNPISRTSMKQKSALRVGMLGDSPGPSGCFFMRAFACKQCGHHGA